MWKELVVTVLVMVSEGKTMAFDGMEMNSGKIWCGRATQGALGFKPRGSRVKAKMKVVFALNRTTSRRSSATSRRSSATSRRSRGVSSQRRDVPKSGINQRRDVESQRRYVTERCKTNVAMLKANVATFQRRPKMKNIQPWSKGTENSPRAIVTLWTFAVLCMNGSSPILSIAGPESRHPKRDSDYGQKQQTNIS